MAREEQDREDLLAEATALVRRAEILFAGDAVPLVAGFRRDGCASLYFSPDLAYHFNTRKELRRAYVGGLLYKAQHGRLVGLQRQRGAVEVALVRHELDEQEMQDFMLELAGHLDHLRSALNAGQYEVLGQVPTETGFVPLLHDWLRDIRQQPSVANVPNAN